MVQDTVCTLAEDTQNRFGDSMRENQQISVVLYGDNNISPYFSHEQKLRLVQSSCLDENTRNYQAKAAHLMHV